MASHLNRYEGIPEDNTLSLTTSKVWSDSIFDDMEVYKLSQRGGGELVQIFESMRSEMTSKSAGKLSHHKIIVLACHVAKPSQEKYTPLISDYPPGKEDMDIGMTFVEQKSSDETKEKTTKSKEAKGSADKKGSESASKTEQSETPFQKTGSSDVFSQSPSTNFTDVDIKYVTFLGGLLLKLITKTPENVANSWKPAGDRFRGFFLESPNEWLPTPNIEWLKSLKEYMNHDKKGIRTVLKVIQSVETEYTDPDSNEAGLGRFLFSLPLSYTGMHAYKLFLAVRQASGKSNKFLLNALMHPKTVTALDEIAYILTNLESRAGKNMPSKFRYARLIGPQYFMALQTRNCKALVYCLVSVLSHYTSGESENFKPEQIFGIQSLATNLKTQMAEAARLIVNTVSEDEKELYSQYMLDAIAASNRPAKKLQVGISSKKEAADKIFGTHT